MKLNHDELIELRIANIQYENRILSLELVKAKLQIIETKVESLALAKNATKGDESVLLKQAAEAKNVLDEVVDKIKTKYGLNDNDQIDWKTGDIQQKTKDRSGQEGIGDLEGGQGNATHE